MSDFTDILPAEVSCLRKDLPDGKPAWYFNHTELGELGRVTVQGTPNGQARILTEITGDGSDPMAARRREIFEPIAAALIGELERLSGNDEADAYRDPAPAPSLSHVIPSKLMQCSRCDGFYAHLIFVEDPATAGELENAARLMFPQIKQIDLPTWIIGASMEAGVPEHAKSMILKVWPDHQDIQHMTPDAFNKCLRELERAHCSF